MRTNRSGTKSICGARLPPLSRAISETLENRVLMSGTGTISGTVYADPTQSGALASNTGIAGRQVFVDVANNGVFTAGDFATTSDANGHYTISGISPGTYTVRDILPMGWGQTAPSSFAPKVTVTADQTSTLNFGQKLLTGALGSPYDASVLPAGGFVRYQLPEANGDLLVFGVDSSANGYVARFFADGSPDLRFGSSGVAANNLQGVDVVGGTVLLAGSIIVVGNTSSTTTAPVIELNSDGSFQRQFAWDPQSAILAGYAYLGASTLPNGNILISGDTVFEQNIGVDSAEYVVYATELDAASGLVVASFGTQGTTSIAAEQVEENLFQSAYPDTLGGFYVVTTWTEDYPSLIGEVQHFNSSGNQTSSVSAHFNTEAAQYNVAPLIAVQVGGDLLIATVVGSGINDQTGDQEASIEIDSFNSAGTDSEYNEGLGVDYGQGGSNEFPYANEITGLDALPDGRILVLAQVVNTDGEGNITSTSGVSVEFGSSATTSDDLGVIGGSSGGIYTVPQGSNLGGGAGNASGAPPLFSSTSGLFAAATDIEGIVTPPTTAAAPTAGISHAFVNGSVGFTNTYTPQPAVIFADSVASLNITATAPTAIWQTPKLSTVTDANDLEVLQVEYKDTVAVDLRSLSSSNLQITLPDGTTENPTYLGVEKTGNNQNLYADYAVPTPAGGWTPANNGQYKVALLGNQVSNDAITAAANNSLGSFTVTIANASAQLLAVPPITTAGGTTVALSVTYTNLGVPLLSSTVDVHDLSVTGPGGVTLTVTAAVAGAAVGNQVTAAYTVAASNGGWTQAANGQYTVSLKANQITDTAGTPLAAATLGTFTVSIGTTVVLPASSVTLSIPVTSIQTGNLVLFTATVIGSDGGTPGGPVTFSQNSTVLGTATLAGGTASFSTATLPAGTDTITAAYSGSESYGGSTSAAQAVTVTAAPAGAEALTPTLLQAKLPLSLVAGVKHKLAIPITITNTGGQTASGLAQIVLYASLDGSLDANDPVVTTLRRNLKLRANKSSRVTLQIPGLPNSLGTGTFHLLAQVIDAAGFAQTASTPTSIVVAAPYVSPVISFAKVTVPTLIVAGAKARGTVKISVTNNGNVAISGPVFLQLYLTSNETTAGGTLIKSVTMRVNVPVTKTKKISVAPGLIPLLTAGNYQFAIVLRTSAAGDAVGVTVSAVDTAIFQVLGTG